MLSIGVSEKVTGHGAPAVLGVSYSCPCCQVLPLLGAFPLPHPTEQPVFHRADCFPWVPLTVPEATGLPEVRKGQYNSQGYSPPLTLRLILSSGHKDRPPGWRTLHLHLQAISTSRHLRRHSLHRWEEVPPCLAPGLNTGQAGGNSILAKSARASLYLTHAMRTEFTQSRVFLAWSILSESARHCQLHRAESFDLGGMKSWVSLAGIQSTQESRYLKPVFHAPNRKGRAIWIVF